MCGRFLSLVVLLLCLGRTAAAHEVRPGYLEIRETAAGHYSILWRIPSRDGLRLAIEPQFPQRCHPDPRPHSQPQWLAASQTQLAPEPLSRFSTDTFTQQFALMCPGGLVGETIGIAGLATTMTDVLTRVARADGTAQVVLLTPSSPSFIASASPSTGQLSLTYLRMGVGHILSGVDHLLFILALLLLVQGWRKRLATVTAFTLAHSITLVAASLGFVRVPQTPVEAVIALSIVFVAAQLPGSANRGQESVSQRWPWVIAFVFGLLHGFGFAGALAEIGLPQKSIPMALFCFNVGVELGQLLFLAAVTVLARLAQRLIEGHRVILRTVLAYGIGSVAAFWCVQRVAAFF